MWVGNGTCNWFEVGGDCDIVIYRWMIHTDILLGVSMVILIMVNMVEVFNHLHDLSSVKVKYFYKEFLITFLCLRHKL